MRKGSLSFAVLFLANIALSTFVFGAIEMSPEWVLSPKTFQFELPPVQRTKPLLIGDILYYATREGVVGALHREQNYRLWEIKLPSGGPINGAFAYGRSKLFIGDQKGNFYALQARDGVIAWQVTVDTQWLSPPAISRDKVFVLGSNDELYVFSETDGKEKWHYARKSGEKMTIWGTSTPTIYGSEVYVGFSDGHLVCLSTSNGRMVWANKLRSRQRFYDIDMQPYVDEKMVLAATFDGNLYSLDRVTGQTLWMLKIGSYGDFTVDAQKIYLSGLNGTFYAIDQNSHDIIWKTSYDATSGVGLQPVKVQDSLVVATSGDPVYVLNPSNGKIESTYHLGAGTLSSPVATMNDSRFYLVSNYGNLFSFVLRNNPASEKKGPETLTLPSAISRVAHTFKKSS